MERKNGAHIVLSQESLRVAVAINQNLGESVVERGILKTTGNFGLHPRKNEFKAVALFNFVNELLDREDTNNRSKQGLDGLFITVHIKESTDDLRGTRRVDPLDVDFDELDEPVLVEVENEIVHKVEAIADNDKRKLVGEFGLFEEVFDFLRVVEVALAAETLHFADLASTGCGLDIFEVDLGVLAQVHDRTKEVVQSLSERLDSPAYDRG